MRTSLKRGFKLVWEAAPARNETQRNHISKKGKNKTTRARGQQEKQIGKEI